jgi:myo-inositol-1(or 4)-monophosphatase
MAKRAKDQDVLRDCARVGEAIRFAVEAHEGQLRKGTTPPYIVHPMEVLGILAGMDADAELLMAGVLHDCIEDGELPCGEGRRPVTRGDIAERFGERVASLVAAHSEDKSLSWEERKTIALNELAEAEPDLQKMVLADKLSNMRAIARDYRAVGDALWTRFQAPKDKQAWYYAGGVEALKTLASDEKAAPFYEEFCARYREVFETFER